MLRWRLALLPLLGTNGIHSLGIDEVRNRVVLGVGANGDVAPAAALGVRQRVAPVALLVEVVLIPMPRVSLRSQAPTVLGEYQIDGPRASARSDLTPLVRAAAGVRHSSPRPIARRASTERTERFLLRVVAELGKRRMTRDFERHARDSDGDESPLARFGLARGVLFAFPCHPSCSRPASNPSFRIGDPRPSR